MKRAAVYAGSFDPLTLGHLDIIQRVAPLFDRLYLAVGRNQKKQGLFRAEERAELIRGAIKSARLKGDFHVEIVDGLIVDFCKEHEIHVLIRGLRALSDFETELQISSMNRKLAPKIETFHVMTAEKYFFLSSSTREGCASIQIIGTQLNFSYSFDSSARWAPTWTTPVGRIFQRLCSSSTDMSISLPYHFQNFLL